MTEILDQQDFYKWIEKSDWNFVVNSEVFIHSVTYNKATYEQLKQVYLQEITN